MGSIKKFQDTNIKELIDRLDNTLQSMGWYANTYLAYNLIVLAAVADAMHLRKVMEMLSAYWCKRLPFVGEEGVDLDWDHVKSRLHPYKVNGNFDSDNPLFEEIREWEEEQEELLKTERKKEGVFDVPCALEQDKLWDAVSDDYILCNENRIEWIPDVKHFLALMSLREPKDVVALLMYELYKIQLLADKLKAILRTPSQIILNKERRDELINEFFERIQKKCHIKVEKVKNEYVTWFETYQENMSLKMLEQKLDRYRKKLEASGFLDDMMKLYRHNIDPDDFINRFYDDKGLKNYFAGFYIYTRQLKYSDWKKKTEQFLIYIAVKEIIDKDKIPFVLEQKKEEVDRLQETALPTRNELIARSVRQLMDERDEENKGALVKYNNQWIAIYRVLVDYYGFSDKYVEFVKQVKDLDLDGIRIPCTLDGVKKVAGILTKDFNDWVAHKESINSKKPAFLRQYEVAARLLKILEALGIEKIKKP